MWTLCPHNPPNLERGARRGQFRLPPNERRRLLARFTCDHGADWPLDWRVNAVGEGLPSPTSHSNRSLRTEVSVAGKRNFQGRDKEAETALEIQGRRCRDKISLGNSANSGQIAGFREISVRTRMRGGAERTRTACQARSRYRIGLSRVSPPRQFCDRMSLSDNIIQKGLAFGRHWSGTVR